MKRDLSQGWSDYAQHFRSSDDVVRYDDLFASDVCERVCWAVQRPILLDTLKDLLARHSAGGAQALDFACGTGRVTTVVEEAGWAVAGLDASPAMLDLARKRLPTVEFHEGRLGEPSTDEWASAQGSFALITAFRFFLNAEVDERESILKVLVDHLAPGGHVVLNNHGSGPSLRSFSLRVRRKSGSTVLTQHAFRTLIHGTDLEIECQWGGHMMNRSLYGMAVVGPAVRAIERLLPRSRAGRGLLRRFGANQTYVCSRR